MKINTILTLLLIYSNSLFINAQNDHFREGKKNSIQNKGTSFGSQCDNKSVDIILYLRDRRSTVSILNYSNLNLITNIYDGITFNIDIQDYRTKDTGELNLYIHFPINTTLDPIKIPPVNTTSSRQTTTSVSVKSIQEPSFPRTIRLPLDAFETDNDFSPLKVKRHSFYLELKKQGYVSSYKTPHVFFDAYDPNDYPYLSIANFSAYKMIENNDVLLRTNVKSDSYSGCNTKINYYISEDSHYDSNSILIGSQNIDALRFNRSKQVDFILDSSIYQNYIGKYIIALLFTANGSNESVKILPLNQLEKAAPDLYISDARIYESNNGNSVSISCTVKNIGNMISPQSKIEFYNENFPRRLIQNSFIKSLSPEESSVVTITVTRQYYSLRIYGRNLIIVLDPENTITELNESDNEKRYYFPHVASPIENIVTVSPNPFDHEVNFNFTTNYPNKEIKLNIYDQQGRLQYHTNKSYPQPGDYSIKVARYHLLSDNTYYYSFNKGNNYIFVQQSGIIIKNN